jgi:hypothetical protein
MTEATEAATLTLVVAEAADLASLTPRQLYDEVEWRITERSIYSREWTPEYRRWFNGQIRKYRRELNRRDLPGRSWQYEAQCEAEDVRDERDTQADALGTL